MKITLRVPDDLKARMDAVDGVNWSAVAREAFEMKVLQINAQKDEATMDDVIERLRATRKQSKGSEEAKGKQLGRDWAKGTATIDELEALEEADSEHGIIAGDPCAPYGWVDIVFMTARRWDEEKDGRCEDAEDWWRDEVGGRRYPSEDTLRGFIDGALEVLSEVEGRL